MTKQKARSKYDELHDRFAPILSGKSGTRYERLAAMVWKILHEQNAVIHDVRMAGTSRVKHQIDVRMQRDGEALHVLIECKDYDLRGAKVGLGVVRDFRSVIEDVGAGEGIILTCNGFTRDARKYAKAKGIKLVLLRAAEPTDLQGRLQKIVLNIRIRGVISVGLDHIRVEPAFAQELEQRLQSVAPGGAMTRSSPAYFVRGGERVQFNDFISDAANKLADAKAKPAGTWKDKVTSKGWKIDVGGTAPIPFEFLLLTYTLADDSERVEITSKRVAEMLLSGFGTDDLLIYGDQLERRQISPDGTVL